MKSRLFSLCTIALFFTVFTLPASCGDTEGTTTDIDFSYSVLFAERTYLLRHPQEVWETWEGDLTAEDLAGWMENFSFITVQVSGMDDKNLQNAINESIIKAMTEWVNDLTGFVVPLGIYPVIHFQSDRFLSFSHEFAVFSLERGDNVINVITIDMRSGERVELRDLVDVDIDFAKKLLALNDAHLQETRAAQSSEGLLSQILEASHGNSDSLGEIMFRASFHLEESRLNFTFHGQGGLLMCELPGMTVYLDDIADFLLTEAW